MTAPLSLDVLIVTHKPDGIRRVAAMDPPRLSGVKYIVSWQAHESAPVPAELTQRDDFEIHRFDGTGVSANRNNAMRYATADVILIADDDLIYTAEGLETVRRVMADNPPTDYASFMYDGADGKTYPKQTLDLSVTPRGFYQTTFEIALRRNSPAGQLRFNEMFGPGAPLLTAAEDEIFYLTALRRGIRMRFFPYVIATHPGRTTGNRLSATDGELLASGAVIIKQYPLTALLRIPLKAFRLNRSGKATFFRSLGLMTRGALYSIFKVRL